ncbi:hypothetical protein [Sphaerisporangium sp. TRM90804]|uniref:hypothetical protein n=1 Tax=Sphaerisporangium sp. TRM90804 TaxID=3031113 RepID=UPI00244934E6|nr:hypothetical protein [Sphaerisporangium sp. TRM90804]MDH2425770.1 hypothetical protein [Sphaerisporangium sp. TRM90804]
MAEQAASAQKDLAREERRAAAYLDVLTSVNGMTFTIIMMTAVMTTGGEPKQDPLPNQSEQAALKAKVTAYGSPEARAIFDEWYKTAQTMVNTYNLLQMDLGPDVSRADLWKKQEASRMALNEASEQLNDQMNRDLTR